MKKVLTFILISFIFFPVRCMEIKSLIPIDGIRWTLETARGFQNIENAIISKLDGSTSYTNQVLAVQGILFHSYYKNILLTQARFNVGFLDKTHFFWTDQPDFFHEYTLNGQLRCIELDIQKMFPVKLTYRSTLFPFAGYSFFEHSRNMSERQNGMNGSTNKYNSVVGGIQYETKVNRIFTQSCFVSYSPLVFLNYSRKNIQILNYGFEIAARTNPFSLILFYNNKKIFHQKGVTWFNGINGNMNASEFGVSMHMKLF